MASWYQRAARCRQIVEDALSTASEAEGVGMLKDYVADGDPSVREAALRALGQLGQHARQEALDMLMVAVDDEVDSTRVEAFRALAKVAEHGCQLSVALARHEARSLEASTAVRAEALQVLLQKAVPGDWVVVSELATTAREPDPLLRSVAVEALAALSPGGAELVIAALAGQPCSLASQRTDDGEEATAAESLRPHPQGLGSIKDPDWEVRLAALAGLRRLAPREHQRACDAAGDAVKDSRWEVRVAAATALCDLAPHGDLEAACMLVDLCKDPSFAVRKAALRALSVLEKCTDGSTPHGIAVTACLECWENSLADAEVSAAALEAAVELVGFNAEEVVRFVARALESTVPEARAAASEALMAVTNEPSDLLVAQLVRRVIDDRAPVRRDAIRALQKVLPHGHSKAVQQLVSHIAKADSHVRKAVVEALQCFGSRGDESAAQGIVSRLWDEDAAVRAAAVKAVVEVAPFNNDKYITRVCLALEDDDRTVREAVVEALPKVADPHNRTAIQCLTHCVRNTMKYPKCENTRESACRALAKWARSGSEEAVYVICGTICQDYPQASAAALRALPLVARRGDRAAIDGVASALSHKQQRTRDIASEVLEQLADRGPVAPASSSVATLLEGSWTGGTIRGSKIIWGDSDMITPFEIRNGCVLTTVCVDQKGRKFPSWARLDAYDCLRWDFGADWNRVLDPPNQANARTQQLEHQIFGEQVSPAPCTAQDVEQEQTCKEEVEIGDAYAVAAVAAHFKSGDEAVRKAAVAALPRVVGKGSKAALEALLPMMTDEAVLVRFAAVESLAAVAERDDLRAIEALKVRLEDQERPTNKETGQQFGSSVGMAAAKVLKKLVSRKEDLASIVSGLRFSGPSLRGF